MAPLRKQPIRSGPEPTTAPRLTARQTDALSDFRSRRLQRRLEDLERTNATDIPATSFVPPTHAAQPALTVAQAQAQALNKKKQSGNVRKILYAKKSLKDWLDELPANPRPPYIQAAAPEPVIPPRKICSSCGYTGAYKCERCGEWSCDRVCLDVHERDGGCGVGG